MALEEIGFSAVIKGVVEYVNNSKKMAAANREIAKSVQNLSKISIGGVPQFSSASRTQIANIQAQHAALSARNRELLGTFGQFAAGSAIGGTTRSFALAGAAAGTLGNAVGGVKKRFDDFLPSLSKSAYALGRFQFVVISVAAVLASLALPAKLASDLEETIVKIGNLTEVPKEALAGLKEELRSLSEETSISPQALGEGAYQVLSSGIRDTATAMEVLRVAAEASTIGLGETKTIASVLTSVLNAYQLTVKDVAFVQNTLLQAVRLGKGEATELAQSLGFTVPIAAQLGIEFEQVAAVLATLTNQGLSASHATTALTGVLNQLLQPSEESKKVFEALGIDLVEFRKEVDNNFIAAMQRLFEVTGGNAAIIAQLFPDIRGLRGALAAFGNQAGQTSHNLEVMINDLGLAERAIEEARNTTEFKFKRAVNELQIALTDLGTAALPTVTDALENISAVLRTLRTEGPKVFEDWKPVLETAGEGLQDILKLLKDIVDFVTRDNTGLFFGAAGAVIFAWALPGGPVLVGLGLIATAVALITTNLDEMGLSALNARLQLLNLELSAVAGFDPIADKIGDIGELLDGLGDEDTPLTSFLKGIDEKSQERLKELLELRAEIEAEIAGKVSEQPVELFSEDTLEKYSRLNVALSLTTTNQNEARNSLRKMAHEYSLTTDDVFKMVEVVAEVNRRVADGTNFNAALVGSLKLADIETDSFTASQIALAAASGTAGIAQNDLAGFMSLVGRAAAEEIVKIALLRAELARLSDTTTLGILGFAAARKAIQAQSAFDLAFGGTGGPAVVGAPGGFGPEIDVSGAAADKALAEVNPFEELVKQEDIREILLKIGTTGKATWQDIARLWSLGAKDAANKLAKVMRGEIEGLGATVEEAFKNVAIEFMGELEQGIIEGTVDILDAIHALEAGMVDAARSIVESLALQAKNIGEQWEILVKVLESGAANLQDVERLFEIGATDAALELLRLMAGQENILSDSIKAFKRSQTLPFFPTAGQMHSGGYIPPGKTMLAQLHGPEAVIPLGSDNAMLGALARLSNSLGGIGDTGGFRNYGQVSISANNQDDRIIRAMTRALRSG